MTPGADLPRRRADAGQASLEHLGVVLVVAVLVAGVVAALAVNASAVGAGASRAVCLTLTAGLGDCAAVARAGAGEERAACAPSADAAVVRGLGAAFVEAGRDRGVRWEERPDGSFRVQQGSGGLAPGAGPQLGLPAAAAAAPDVAFRSGQEWVVRSPQERDALVQAAGWARVDALLAPVPGGSALPRLRDAVGLGSSVPAPDRVFVGGGGYADASSYAGADASVPAPQGGSTLLGTSWSPDAPEDRTLYYRTAAPASALTALAVASSAAEDSGTTLETLTTVTVRGGEVVRASRSGIDAGVQYDAVLDVGTGDDERAVTGLARASGVDLAAAGVTAAAPARRTDPAAVFAAAVRERGELTRVEVAPAADDPTTLAYDRPEVFDGRGYSARPSC